VNPSSATTDAAAEEAVEEAASTTPAAASEMESVLTAEASEMSAEVDWIMSVRRLCVSMMDSLRAVVEMRLIRLGDGIRSNVREEECEDEDVNAEIGLEEEERRRRMAPSVAAVDMLLMVVVVLVMLLLSFTFFPLGLCYIIYYGY